MPSSLRWRNLRPLIHINRRKSSFHASNTDGIKTSAAKRTLQVQINEEIIGAFEVPPVKRHRGYDPMWLSVSPPNTNKSLEKLSVTIEKYLEHMDTVNVVTLFHHCAKYLTEADFSNFIFSRPEVILKLHALQEKLSEYDVSSIMFSMKGFTTWDDSLADFVRVVTEKVRHSKAFRLSNIEVTKMMHGLRNMSSEHEEIRELLRVIAPLIQRCNDFDHRAFGAVLGGMRSMSSQDVEVRNLLSIVTAKLAETEKNLEFNAQSGGSLVEGLQGMSSQHKEVRGFLTVAIRHIQYIHFDTQAISNALWGMQSMDSRHEEVRDLLVVLDHKIRRCTKRFTPHNLGSMFIGMQYMSSEHEEVRRVLAALLPHVERCSTHFKSLDVCKVLYGMQGMSDDHEEVRAVLRIVLPALERIYSDDPHNWLKSFSHQQAMRVGYQYLTIVLACNVPLRDSLARLGFHRGSPLAVRIEKARHSFFTTFSNAPMMSELRSCFFNLSTYQHLVAMALKSDGMGIHQDGAVQKGKATGKSYNCKHVSKPSGCTNSACTFKHPPSWDATTNPKGEEVGPHMTGKMTQGRVDCWHVSKSTGCTNPACTFKHPPSWDAVTNPKAEVVVLNVAGKSPRGQTQAQGGTHTPGVGVGARSVRFALNSTLFGFDADIVARVINADEGSGAGAGAGAGALQRVVNIEIDGPHRPRAMRTPNFHRLRDEAIEGIAAQQQQQQGRGRGQKEPRQGSIVKVHRLVPSDPRVRALSSAELQALMRQWVLGHEHH